MSARAQQAGFTYLVLIILVAIVGMVGAASLKIGALLQRAAAEEELLDIGAAFSAALQSYAAATPQGQPQQPHSLQDLLKDPRFPGVRRHLRKLFVDPMTGKDEWGVMYAGDKDRVMGVYSLSDAKPFKVANFGAQGLDFEHKEHIFEWKFTIAGQIARPVQAAPLMPASSAAPAPPVEAQAELAELVPPAAQDAPADKDEEDEPVKEKE